MKKLENYTNCLNVLNNADFEMADSDEIYRTGIIRQFHLTYELAWKSLQTVLSIHGVKEVDTASPREVLQLGYKSGFIDDVSVWLLMLRERTLSVYMYDAKEADAMITMIRDRFLPAFITLHEVREKELSDVMKD